MKVLKDLFEIWMTFPEMDHFLMYFGFGVVVGISWVEVVNKAIKWAENKYSRNLEDA